jgi:hypothetical protein
MTSAQEDAKVQSYVQSALRQATGSTLARRDKSAFAILNQKRNRDMMNVYLAAAEHYMYARSQVAEGGYSSYAQMAVLIPGYDGLKWALGLFDKQNWLSTDGTAVTPGNALSVRWGMRGATAGLQDYDDDN